MIEQPRLRVRITLEAELHTGDKPLDEVLNEMRRAYSDYFPYAEVKVEVIE